jgi:hypothetical protein
VTALSISPAIRTKTQKPFTIAAVGGAYLAASARGTRIPPPRLIATRAERPSVLDSQVARLQNARDTLQWLVENERIIKQRLAP